MDGILIYWNAKLKHSGLTAFKKYEGYERKMHHNSLANLVQTAIPNENRNLNPQQSRKCKNMCNKLAYYTQTRKFTSKRTGNYNMKIAFLTLTTPSETTDEQSLKAFESFLDYLRRTANCVYVWKKELGELNRRLHYHIIINNFIPYYIISWKWKLLLIGQGVEWPVNEAGKNTDAHYRIEMPKSSKAIGHYVAKYMAKAYELPCQLGRIFGYSKLLDKCSEICISEFDKCWDEVSLLGAKYRVIGSDYVSHMCVNLLSVKKIAPEIWALFEQQYLAFSEKLTLPQKFHYV